MKKIKRRLWTFCLQMVMDFHTHHTCREEALGAEHSILHYKKSKLRYSAARDFQGSQSRKSVLVKANWIQEKQTNKHKLKKGPEGTDFSGKRRHSMEKTDIPKWTLDNFCMVTGHTFAIKLWQRSHSSVYNCCCQPFLVTGLRSFNEQQLQDL